MRASPRLRVYRRSLGVVGGQELLGESAAIGEDGLVASIHRLEARQDGVVDHETLGADLGARRGTTAVNPHNSTVDGCICAQQDGTIYSLSTKANRSVDVSSPYAYYVDGFQYKEN